MQYKIHRLTAAVLVFVLFIATCATLNPVNAASPDADFTFDTGTGTITGYVGPGGAVDIPSSIGGVPVTAIGTSAFYGLTNITSVIIPYGVTTIGQVAFSGCSNLISVDIPNSVTLIEPAAFYGCSSLASVTIPNGVTTISNQTFEICTGLTSVLIPNSVTVIGLAAFEGCSVLTSVTIPDSVTTIDYQAFANCTGFTSVVIPDSVTSIGGSAFAGCTGLSEAIFMHSDASAITTFDTIVFDNCAAGFKIYYPPGATGFTNPWNTYPAEVNPYMTSTQAGLPSSSSSASVTTDADTVLEFTLSHDGDSKDTDAAVKEATVSEPAPDYLTTVTPPVEVSWKSKDESGLIYISTDEETSDTQPLYVMLQYVDGRYEFLDIAYTEGIVTAMLGNGDVVQLLRLDAGEIADYALPGYVPLDYLVYMTNKLNDKITEYDGVMPDPAGIGAYTAPDADAEWDADSEQGAGIAQGTQALRAARGKLYSPAGIQLVSSAAAATSLANDHTQPKYDPRGMAYFPTVKDQKGTSLCWDFSALSAVEANLGRQNAQRYDFSEANAAFALSYEGEWGFQRGVTDAGNFKMLMSYLTRLDGPVPESADPFDSVLEEQERETVTVTPVAYVTGFVQVPNDAEQVKRYITDTGSVITGVYMADGKTSKSYNSKTNAYYIGQSVTPNHAVQIVGWDDRYSRDNFLTKPSADGAWIVKNSWGEKNDDRGYFYVSYEDSLMQRALYAVTGVSHTDAIDHMYLFDPFGEIGKITYNTNDVWFSNVFTKQEDKEKLSAVSFYSSNTNASYDIWVSATGEFADKELVKSGTLSASGYHTVGLDEQVMLESSEFAVFVKLSSTEAANVSVQKNMDGYLHKAVSEPGRSFVSADGDTWTDIAEKYNGAHVCLRAMTISDAIKPAYISGYPDGTFRPDDDISRAEAAALISKALELAPGSSSSFTDNDSDSWYFGYVSVLEQKGCFDRLGTSFDPTATVTREDFCYILSKALGIEPDAADSEFSDISGSYAKAQIQALYALGIITGYPDGTFRPSESISRAEMVSLVNRATGRYQDVSYADSPFTDVDPSHWAFADIVRAGE